MKSTFALTEVENVRDIIDDLGFVASKAGENLLSFLFHYSDLVL